MNILGNVLGAVAPLAIQWGKKALGNTNIGRSIGNKLNRAKQFIQSDTGQKLVGVLAENPKYGDLHSDHHPEIEPSSSTSRRKKKGILKNKKKRVSFEEPLEVEEENDDMSMINEY